MEVLLDTVAASQWLTARGVRRTAATLKKLRSIGGGPRFKTFNGKPLYTEAALTGWIEERLIEPVPRNTEAAA